MNAADRFRTEIDALEANAFKATVLDSNDFDASWRRRFELAANLAPLWAAAARPALLGFSAFVDAYVRLDRAGPLFSADAPEPARLLAAELIKRIRSGTGGEYGIDWRAGDFWMAAHLPHTIGAGGTSAQIANALALLGAPALLALADRSPGQIGVLSRDILVAADGAARRLADIDADPRRAKARHWIFESLAGTEVAGLTVTRSTRVIVRLVDDAPEDDPAFAALSRGLAPGCGAAVLSSLVSTPDALIEETLRRIGGLAREWRDAGLGIIHIELADYGRRPHLPTLILEHLAGAVTSVGMSLSEWRIIGGADADASSLAAFARRHGLSRLCIHADDFALALTDGDPEREASALVAGCLLAGARAAAGKPVRPERIADEARFTPPPAFPATAEGFSVVACPAPWLRRPASTIGLGDTFLAGTMLVHCQPPGAALLD